MKTREVHRKTIEKYGVLDNVDKAISEYYEVIETLRNIKTFMNNTEVTDIPKNLYDKLVEELADSLNMTDKLTIIFEILPVEINTIKHTKMLRTLRRLNDSTAN